MPDFDENLLRITQYDILEKLPDLFTMNNGEKVKTREQWEERRKELYKAAVEMQYGTIPPKPEFLDIDPLDDGKEITSFRITTGTRAKPVSFTMRVLLPAGNTHCPVIVDGDLCWQYFFDKDFLKAVLDEQVIFVMFNRTELAPDRKDLGRKGPLYDTYPEYTFSALAAWAWGYTRCVDALEKLGIGDLEHIAFTGHSRGGKTALLAGVLDERACIVNPNDSGAGGAGCYRVHMEAAQENGNLQRSERLSDLIRSFPFWFGPDMPQYVDKEEKIPFDEHFLKALVAPRILMETNAASDIWANPIGTWQTSMAAREVYKFLGAEEKQLFYYRKGYHEHHVTDISRLAKTLKNEAAGKIDHQDSFVLPFKKKELAFDWRCPEEEK